MCPMAAQQREGHRVVTDYTQGVSENSFVKVYVRARPPEDEHDNANELFDLGDGEGADGKEESAAPTNNSFTKTVSNNIETPQLPTKTFIMLSNIMRGCAKNQNQPMSIVSSKSDARPIKSERILGPRKTL